MIKSRPLMTAVLAGSVLAAAPALAQEDPAPKGQSQQVQLTPKLVEEIQHTLNKHGYAAGHVDGTWGEDTSKALKSFQEDHGLQATGDVNVQTMKALKLLDKEAKAAKKSGGKSSAKGGGAAGGQGKS